MDGIFVKEFASASAAAKELGLNHSSISKSANGDILTYNGYIWQYKNDDNIENVMLQLKKVSKTGKNKKRVSQYSLNNEFI